MTMQFRDAFTDVSADSTAGSFSGYASTAWRVDSYGTAMASGAFAKTLAERADRVPLLYQHNPNLNVGVPTSLTEDMHGLAIEARLFDDGADGSVLLRRMRQGGRFGMSFGFRTLQDRGVRDADPVDLSQMPDMRPDDVRVITEVKLYEVSVVTFPANEAAAILAVRNDSLSNSILSVAAALRDGDLSDEQRDLLMRVLAGDVAPDGDAEPRDQFSPRRRDAEIALARWRGN